jgi:hypothetical protein
MTWLFERTIECAAWVAMIVAWVAAVITVYWLVQWFGTLRTEADPDLLWKSAQSATACVAFSVALGVLACIDRFIFDADEVPKR